ncbi:MAG TPA: hypothetical protein PLI77_07160 [Bacteroidales bacterium]|nr:hypothetical protein [Bacteroidales bacterium]HRW33607.1 hypothetical protein [Thermotogota bacterium]
MMDHVVRELNDHWFLRDTAGTKKYAAKVPGSVYEALLDNQIIENPFYGVNEKKCEWIWEKDWEFSTMLNLNNEISEKENLMLRFHGLDTMCEVCLNDRIILFGDNMHRTYDVYIKTKDFNYLEEVDNTLTITFRSPVVEAHKRLMQITPEIDVQTPYSHLPFAIPGVETLRKAYYSFGWDWGPKIPDSGIWRKVELHAFNTAFIQDIYIHTDIDFIIGNGQGTTTANQAVIVVETELSDFCQTQDKKISYELYDNGKNILTDHINCLELGSEKSIILKNPKLWWTHDLGEPNLYFLKIKLFEGNQLLDEYQSEFGIRDIQLIRNKDKWGESFYFELNKVPIFAKGGNWIPSDSILPQGTREKKYETVLESCIASNMNMIRVWGGGIFEEDGFYDFCDRKGLLVWQDFPFACRPTPNFSGFEESIIRESIVNIKRLRNHPSLAIWVGNNEIEEGWLYWGFEDYVPQFKNFYLRLFEETLPKLVSEYDAKRSYWPSSPSSGGNFSNPQSPDYGDSHYWKVWHEGYPFESYREFDSRFMSEFGFESFPDLKTIKMFCEPSQMYYNSVFMENHQKNTAGNQKIFDYMSKRFNIPKSFENQVILSQITQAEAMAYGVEHWRRNRNNCHCMGALYWQINDCWPVASWSSIDYYGRWKALHYFAKRFYSPLYINAYETDHYFEIWLCNDSVVKFNGKYQWTLLDLSGKIQYRYQDKLMAPGLFSTLAQRVNISDIGVDVSQSVLYFEAFDESGRLISDGFKLFSAPKDLKLEKPEIKFSLQKVADGYSIVVETDKPALYCRIESSQDICFGDNYFCLLEGGKIIEFQYPGEITHKDISIRSLYDYLH